ncbi:MAG: hypothetical protein CMP10_11275 [Zetaproteobacteria bacterium]|nr:hypothetical protein [Pseudobdellovibrionaceae bacterium]
MRSTNKILFNFSSLGFYLGVAFFAVSAGAYAKSYGDAYTIKGKKYSIDDVYRSNQSSFYELEKKKYELIEKFAEQGYLESFWADLAKKKGVSKDKATDDYLSSRASVAKSEIDKALKSYQDHPRLKDLSEADKRKQITDYLKSLKTQEVVGNIVAEARKSRKLVVHYPKPSEPIYKLTVDSADPVKYGPKLTDTKPLGCKDDCAITVVEYSEYQCPFCVRVLPAINRLLSEYKGKVRWIVRDFPLGFHDRARPAAVAARCGFEQGKFWQMYDILFKNQRALTDENLKTFGKKIGLDDAKYQSCLSNPGPRMALIDKNYRSGEELGVTGTPAFFINGRRVSGALPFEQFKKIFDEELEKKGKK